MLTFYAFLKILLSGSIIIGLSLFTLSLTQCTDQGRVPRHF